ncbi:restriction endonuclease subunit S [Prevotella nigrescens]|uniref:restriction endonuclease subunit S n=1 Tax=Prevotella nigrescens TaxID=28133 RepID=UPI001C5E29BD|nr:restriction endonuclease subunit S [Prevotella nigrescens]MBW4725769.1 restriction endonuclease subunit S [Prevotella nigrescens]
MEEWKEYRYTDLATIIGGGTPKTSVPEYWSGEIPWLSVKDFVSVTKYVYDTEKHISELGLLNSSTKLLEKNDIVISARGTVGAMAMIPDPMCFNQSCFGLRGNNIVDKNFLYYLTRTKVDELRKTAHGSVFDTITRETFDNLRCLVPPLQTQQKIGNILSSLDSKIELNKRINDNLEQQAQALFKSWFVDFEPFLREEFFKSDSLFGDIPVEWHIVAIKDLSVYITDYVANGSFASLRENVRLYDKPNYAHFIRNTDLKAESYKMYVDKHSYEFLSKSVLEGGEIIISNVGDVGSVFLCPKLEKPMTLGNNIILLRPKKDYLTFYLYMLFKGGIGQHLIDGVTGGSAQRKFNKTDFKSIKLMMPPVNILIKFDRIIKPIFSKIEENRDEISRLTSLRDTLLPKLMSGELKINDINN